MNENIEAILLDVGGTLRGSYPPDKEKQERALVDIATLMQMDIASSELYNLLQKRITAYSVWARETLNELHEEQLWSEWLLPDLPYEMVRKHAMQLTKLWRKVTATRKIFPETKEILTRLFRRGYRVGIVSNTATSIEVPEFLNELEISGLMETVILSCQFGKRKPDPEILLEAAKRMDLDPAQCAYIGDRHDRDVAAARAAGFAAVILLQEDTQKFEKEIFDPRLEPDAYIQNLMELDRLFPEKINSIIEPPHYKASLSTMWAINKFPGLEEFFIASQRLGFQSIELNHQVDSKMLDGIDMGKFHFSSIHEPCPADISANELKQNDWLISSTNEEFRQIGVNSIKRSIQIANELNAPMIVVHCGQVDMDLSLEIKLRELYSKGLKESHEYSELKNVFISKRKLKSSDHISALKKSLVELIAEANKYHIRLGLENRYHYFDIPTPDEMTELLAVDEENLGFVYDVGHAQTLEALGFFPHEEWLKRFSSRMLEVHLHDVRGITDHYAPGCGEVDFEMVASYLPKDAIRTFELHTRNSNEDVKAGLSYLVKKGCIFTIS